jgi:hypothetical protein
VKADLPVRRTGLDLLQHVVGVAGFEPTASSSRKMIMVRRCLGTHAKCLFSVLVDIGMIESA